jgi:hypothetical protein
VLFVKLCNILHKNRDNNTDCNDDVSKRFITKRLDLDDQDSVYYDEKGNETTDDSDEKVYNPAPVTMTKCSQQETRTV